MIKNNKPFRLISVSGSSSTGKSLFTKNLSSTLDWTIFSLSDKLREIAKTNKIDILKINSLPDIIHRELDDEMIKTIKEGNHLILESRLAGWQSKDYLDIFKILIICDEKIKYQRYALREGLSIERAKQEILKRDQSNAQQYIHLYQADNYLNPDIFNLIIDSSQASVEEEVKMALEKFNQGY